MKHDKFNNLEIWKLSELGKEMKMKLEILHKKIQYWISKGYIQLINNSERIEDLQFEIVDKLTKNQQDSEEDDSMISSTQEQQKQDMSVYEPLIMGMLTNLDSMPLDR